MTKQDKRLTNGVLLFLLNNGATRQRCLRYIQDLTGIKMTRYEFEVWCATVKLTPTSS